MQSPVLKVPKPLKQILISRSILLFLYMGTFFWVCGSVYINYIMFCQAIMGILQLQRHLSCPAEYFALKMQLLGANGWQRARMQQQESRGHISNRCTSIILFLWSRTITCISLSIKLGLDWHRMVLVQFIRCSNVWTQQWESQKQKWRGEQICCLNEIKNTETHIY